jgi:NAD(P)H-nitrite reductase large subunit
MSSVNRDLIICRCEEVTLGEILDAIDQGCRTVDEVKRMTRAGMGICQGRTCGPLVAKIISERTGIPIGQIKLMKPQFPIRPIKLNVIARSPIPEPEDIHANNEGLEAE